MQTRRIAIVTALGLLAACDKATGTSGVSGSFSFNFAGGISGTYTASGVFPTSAAQQATQNWASGQVDASADELWVAAAVPATSTTHNYALLVVDRTTVGASSVVSSCSTSCTDFVFLFGASNTSTTALPQQFCFLSSGTVNITSISSTRATGTFTGTGTCDSSTGATTSFSVTNGTFDVPLVSGII